MPEGSAFIEGPKPSMKSARANLFVPLPVEGAYRFFLRQARKRSSTIVFKDQEGFEAEVYSREPNNDLILVRIYRVCDTHSVVSIETFRRK